MEVKDVQGYLSFDQTGNLSYHFISGQIIVQQDGWFEGFMRIALTDNKNDIGFVFGVYHLDKLIDLFYCSEKNDFMYRFHCDYQNQNRNGKVSSIEIITLKDSSYSNCFLSIKNNVKNSQSEIQSKIIITKSLLSDSFMTFYQRLLSQRDKFTKTVLECYWNSHYEKMDISKFLELCESNQNVNEVVSYSHNQYLKKKYDHRNLKLDLPKTHKTK